MSALLDTSVFVAVESGRPADLDKVPDEASVSTITMGELKAGVLAADDVVTKSRRLRTFQSLARYATYAVDEAAADHWAELRILLRDARRRMKVNDLWIASIARANGLTVVTQDDDFDVLADLELLEVIKI